jgi:hypothetical protein
LQTVTDAISCEILRASIAYVEAELLGWFLILEVGQEMKHEASPQRELATRTGFQRIVEIARVGFLVVLCGPGAMCTRCEKQ